jgi:hypothetical protein
VRRQRGAGEVPGADLGPGQHFVDRPACAGKERRHVGGRALEAKSFTTEGNEHAPEHGTNARAQRIVAAESHTEVHPEPTRADANLRECRQERRDVRLREVHRQALDGEHRGCGPVEAGPEQRPFEVVDTELGRDVMRPACRRAAALVVLGRALVDLEELDAGPRHPPCPRVVARAEYDHLMRAGVERARHDVIEEQGAGREIGQRRTAAETLQQRFAQRASEPGPTRLQHRLCERIVDHAHPRQVRSRERDVLRGRRGTA